MSNAPRGAEPPDRSLFRIPARRKTVVTTPTLVALALGGFPVVGDSVEPDLKVGRKVVAGEL